MPRAFFVGLLVLTTMGCKSADKVSDGIARRANDCSTGATAYIALRKGAGDYDKAESDKRVKETEDDLKACAIDAAKAGCCAAAKRVRDRVGKGKVAICDDFFTALSDDGCVELK